VRNTSWSTAIRRRTRVPRITIRTGRTNWFLRVLRIRGPGSHLAARLPPIRPPRRRRGARPQHVTRREESAAAGRRREGARPNPSAAVRWSSSLRPGMHAAPVAGHDADHGQEPGQSPGTHAREREDLRPVRSRPGRGRNRRICLTRVAAFFARSLLGSSSLSRLIPTVSGRVG
jgi:hypothetical protein